MVLNQDEKAALKLARLQALSTSHKEIIKNILEKEGDINYALSAASLYGISKPQLIGYTALHFACTMDNIDLLVNLLNYGADFTKQNDQGETVLHLLIAKQFNVKEPLDNPFFNAVLSAHVKSKNFSNPRNKDGLSHFHIACMTSNTIAVQFFLENGLPVDESINMDSKFSPGYTPLHFAAMCTNTKIVEILSAHGANMHIADASGMTPLHLLIERRMEMSDSIGQLDMCKKRVSYDKLQELIKENDKIINMLLENMSSDNDCLDSIGLSNFHVACMLQDTSAAQHLAERATNLDQCVNMDSRLWPGYTALHFAAHFSVDTVKMLMNKGANIDAKDSKGLTPLDICIERYKVEDISDIMSLSASWKNILFSDRKTKVLSLIHALTNRGKFKTFVNCSLKSINVRIPMESPLWPGFTPLHLAVLFTERTKERFCENRVDKREMELQIIKFCLRKGADLSVQDSRGRTALHLAFRLNKVAVVNVILCHGRQIPNVSDEDNLSHLHIVCAASTKTDQLKKCVSINAAVNTVYRGTSPVNIVRPGSTPLHVCVAEYDLDLRAKINILLKFGADLGIKDAYGLTPVHWLLGHSFSCGYKKATNQLLNKALNDCVAEEYGVSYLHVACHLNHQVAARRFLKNGADVNLTINYTRLSDDDPLSFLYRYDKFTPLLISSFCLTDIQKLLLRHGADVFAKKPDGSTALSYSTVLHHFVSKLGKNVDLRKRMRREYGWTRLHLACYLLQDNGFQDMVEAESADINAQIFSNSPVWQGCTPLHLLMYHGHSERAYVMSRILLENGADVTAIDGQQNCPISMFFKCSITMNDKAYKQVALLMKYHKDFNVNPVSIQGVSFFHVACYLNDVDAVKGFLLHGVDVNRPVDFFADWRPGSTPLHLASQLQIVELLIDHGADIHAEDVDGCTILSEAVKRDVFDENVITKIIERGADINGCNFRGQTSFEIAISKSRITIERLRFFMIRGFLVNSCNPISGVGYLATILGNYYEDRDPYKLIVEAIINEKSTGILGRTTLHHLVTRQSPIASDNYALLLEKLIRSGQDIEQTDNAGKTALHLAVDFQNQHAVSGLLMCGADINALDMNGMSPLTYVFTQQPPISTESESVKFVLSVHACRLLLLNLDLNKINVDGVCDARKSIHDYAADRTFNAQIVKSKEIKLGVRSMCLYDFLTETGAILMYPSLNQSERRKIDLYFELISNDDSVKEIRSFLKLQYRKAIKRLELISSATDSLRLLLDFPLPDLCVENIFQYLRNSDLKNIISAEMDNENMRMDVD